MGADTIGCWQRQTECGGSAPQTAARRIQPAAMTEPRRPPVQRSAWTVARKWVGLQQSGGPRIATGAVGSVSALPDGQPSPSPLRPSVRPSVRPSSRPPPGSPFVATLFVFVVVACSAPSVALSVCLSLLASARQPTPWQPPRRLSALRSARLAHNAASRPHTNECRAEERGKRTLRRQGREARGFKRTRAMRQRRREGAAANRPPGEEDPPPAVAATDEQRESEWTDGWKWRTSQRAHHRTRGARNAESATATALRTAGSDRTGSDR